MEIPILHDIEYLCRFYRKHKPLKSVHPSYSQFGEDLFLKHFFSKKEAGFYVDVGAHDPYRFSNTYLLYKAGWRGINIEANPECFSNIKKVRSRDINVNAAVSDTSKMVSFSCDGPRSGIKDENYHFNEREKEVIQLETKTLSAILDEHLLESQDIDFLSIDCEGHDFAVLKSNDWTKYRPYLILIEEHELDFSSDQHKYLEDNDYTFYSRMGLSNIYLTKAAAAEHLPNSRCSP